MNGTDEIESSIYKGWTVKIYKAPRNWGRPYFAELITPDGQKVGLTRGGEPSRELSKFTTYGSLGTARDAAWNAVNARLSATNKMAHAEAAFETGSPNIAIHPSLK
jgi:hypothetical protein